MAENNVVALPKAEKERLAKGKIDFDLHVGLIMRAEGVSKSKAVFTAYLEGRQGLEKRLAPKA